MKNSKYNKLNVFYRLGIVLLVITMIFGLIMPAKADLISDKRDTLTQIKDRISQQQKIIQQKQNEAASLKGQLDLIDTQIAQLEDQIKVTNLEIETTSVAIEETSQEIKAREIEIEKQQDLLGELMISLYEHKDESVVQMIFAASSFSDFVNKTEYMTSMESESVVTINAIIDLKTELETKKKDLDAKKDDLEKLKAQKQTEESALQGQRGFQADLLDKTKGEEAEYQTQLKNARAEEQSISGEITRLVQQEEARRRQRATSPRDGASRADVVHKGNYSSPLGGGMQVSITGGDYMDPQYGMGFPHTGVDLLANQGTTVYSMGDGVVLLAHDSGGPGLSYVAIDHGNGIVSKYLHLSEIYVNTGDPITKSAVIGATGGMPGSHGAGIFTTGPHLHFEIDDYNGASINPHQYFVIAPPTY